MNTLQPEETRLRQAGFLIATVLLVIMIIYVSLEPIRGTDAYRHIYWGKLVFENRALSFAEDPLLFVAEYQLHDRVYSINWMFQLLVYGIYRFAGFSGLVFFQAVLALATFYFLVRAAGRSGRAGGRSRLSGLVLFILATYAYQKRVEIRPHLVSYLLLAFFMFFIWHTGLRQSKHIVILVLLQLVWANTHIYFFLGPLFWLLYWGEQILYRELARPQHLKMFLILAMLSAVSLINPLGLRAFKDVAGSFLAFFKENPYFVVPYGVLELQSPFTLSGFIKQLYLGSVILGAAGCCLTIIGKRRKQYLFVFVFLISYSFYSSRAAMIFILLCPVFLSQDLQILTELIRKKYVIIDANPTVPGAILNRSRLLTVTGIVLFGAAFWFAVQSQAERVIDRFSHPRRLMAELAEPNVPDLSKDAIAFINRNQALVPDRMFTSYNNGSAYTFFTGRKAFMDSRGTSSAFIRDYIRIENPAYVPSADFKSLVDTYNLNGFICRTVQVNLLRKLYLDGRFEPIYIDEQTVIMARKDTVTEPQLREARRQFTDELQSRVLTLKTAGPDDVDVNAVNMAAALIALDRTDTALVILARCLELSPQNVSAHYNAGIGFLKNNDYQRALTQFQQALFLDPANIAALAGAYSSAAAAGPEPGMTGLHADVATYAELIRARTTPELRKRIRHHYALLGLPVSLPGED